MLQGHRELFSGRLSPTGAGGAGCPVRKMFPDPSLFMTMFILVALTRSGLMSIPKNLGDATAAPVR